MNVLLLMIGCFAGYLVAYHTYGRFLAKRIFALRADAPVPSVTQQDGIDYIPAKREIIFGHHFTSIAGTGPIVGPAIGIIWGWVPAVLWVFFGSILMGAVHDFGSLVISLRHQGKSISEIAATYINPRVRFLFFAIVFISLLIVIAIFGVVIAIVFDLYPESVFSVWLQIPIAMVLGFLVYRRGASLMTATLGAVIVMYLTILGGAWLEQAYPGLCKLSAISFTLAGHSITVPPTGLWTILLLIYAWVASTLPVNILLQPRDYINAWQLFVAMTLMVVGVIVATFSGKLAMAAPAFNTALPADAPPLWPLMFVTIACGAISGFHSLVSSGTSSKQVSNETDAQFVAYGSMLTEGALAILVLICVGAGIAMAYQTQDGSVLHGTEAWSAHYGSWAGAKGLGAKLGAFVTGAANIMETLRIPPLLGTAVMGVFVASFAGTTLDTSVRIQRYVISEILQDIKLPWLANRWSATTLAVVTGAALAFVTGPEGKGAQTLWPLFGTANQSLAALALLVVTLYLRTRGGMKYLCTGIPCAIMLVITNWAMIHNLQLYWNNNERLLLTVGSVLFALSLWMTVEAGMALAGPARKSS
jgi:carbon starvation protein